MLGLVLEGGGTKGAYHVGAYKALLDKNIKIDGITGTSIGALNGALFVQGDYKLAEELWKNLNFSMVINLDKRIQEKLESSDFEIKDLSLFGEALSEIIKQGGLDASPLKEMTFKYLDEDKIRNSPMDFGMVTINLLSKQSLEVFIEDIPEGELPKYLLGSSRLPIFKQDGSDTDIFLDGAFHDNLPFNMLKDKGYKKFILVRTMGLGIVHNIDMDKDDYILIAPREDLGTTLEFNPERSIYNMKLGYYDTIRSLDKLKGEEYYIKSNPAPNFFFDKFSNLKAHQIKALSESMGLNSDKENKRLIFEDIVPKIAFYLNLDNNYSYEDVFLGLLEAKARSLEIDKFHIYSPKGLIEKIKEQNKMPEHYTSHGIFEIIKEKIDMLSTLGKKEAVLKISNIILDL